METLRRKLIGDLQAQRGSFAAVWFIIVLGLAFYGSTYPAGIAMTDSFMATYDRFNYADFTARIGPVQGDPVLDELAEIPGVEAVAGRYVADVVLDLGDLHDYTLRFITLPEDGESAVNGVYLIEGRLFAEPGEILMLESFARHHGLNPGDTVMVRAGEERAEYLIVGLVFAPEYLVAGRDQAMPFPTPSSFGVAYATYETLDSLLRYGSQINDVALTVERRVDETTVRTALEAVLADYELEYVQSRVQTASGGVVDANIRGNMSVAAFFSAMFLLTGTVVMAILLARLMDAEKRRIGTMRALGLSRHEVIWHYISYPVIISVSGAAVGSLTGYLASYLVAWFFIQNLAGDSLPLFVNSPQWGYIVFGSLATIVLALIAGALPTWKASGTPPGIALRPVTPKGLGQFAQIRIPGLPLAAQQALRNGLRVPVRTLSTLVGVTLGCTVILAASGTADSTYHSVDVQYHRGLDFDVRVSWASFMPQTFLTQQVESVEGIAGYEVALYGPVRVSGPDGDLDTLATILPDETTAYRFTTLEGAPAFSSSDDVWVGHNLARVLDISVGDSLSLDALGNFVSADVGGIVDQSIGSVVYVPASLMRTWSPGGILVANAALIRVEEVKLGPVIAAFEAMEGVVNVEIIANSTGDISEYVAFYINFAHLFRLFGFVLTLVVVFNTVNINLRERHEEMLIARSMGARISEIAAAVTWETLAITLVGIVFSIPLGWVALDFLLSNYELDFYGMTNVLAPLSYAITIGGVVIVVLFAEWLSLRHLQHEDLGLLSKTLSI